MDGRAAGGEFNAHAGDVTVSALSVYAVALPACVATEALVRALIAMRDARTQLFTNSGQLTLRIALVALLLGALQVRAIPIAFAVAAGLEARVLLALALRRVARRQRALAGPASAAPQRRPSARQRLPCRGWERRVL